MEMMIGNGDTDDQFLTAKDLERLLKINAKTIYGYVQRGIVPYLRIQSNLRFRRSDIYEWIRQHSYYPGGPKRNRNSQS
jgi:predicted DNA-binding transcriptional regulator AlpA